MPTGRHSLDLMLAADLNLPLDREALAALRQSIAERASLESRDLPACFSRVHGATYAGLVASALAIVADMLGGGALRYVGFKEVWTIEFIPALARAFPDARFIIIERDPRALPASVSAMARRDPARPRMRSPIFGTGARTLCWRGTLFGPPAAVDFYCGPEMQLAGYAVTGKPMGSAEVVRYTAAADAEPGKWRDDTGDLVAALGLEALRHHLLAWPGDIPPELARRCFLLPWVAGEIVAVRRSLAW
jgi:hypothetical protein